MEYIKPMFLLLFVLGIVAAVSSRHAAKHYPVEDAGNQDESSLVKKTLKRQGSSLTSAFDIGEEKNKRKVSSVGHIDDAQPGIGSPINIIVENESGYSLKAVNISSMFGISGGPLPENVKPGKTFIYRPLTTTETDAVAGVFAYYIADIKKTLAVVMLSDPDRDVFHRSFRVGLYDKKQMSGASWCCICCCCKCGFTYSKLCAASYPFRVNDNWQYKSLGSGLTIRGRMHPDKPTIEIEILKE